MTWGQALEIVCQRTGVQNYRKLTAEDNPDVAQRDAYRALVLRLAGETAAPGSARAPRRTQILTRARFRPELWKLVLRCGFRSPGKTGCECARCALRNGARVTGQDCLACVERYGG